MSPIPEHFRSQLFALFTGLTFLRTLAIRDSSWSLPSVIPVDWVDPTLCSFEFRTRRCTNDVHRGKSSSLFFLLEPHSIAQLFLLTESKLSSDMLKHPRDFSTIVTLCHHTASNNDKPYRWSEEATSFELCDMAYLEKRYHSTYCNTHNIPLWVLLYEYYPLLDNSSVVWILVSQNLIWNRFSRSSISICSIHVSDSNPFLPVLSYMSMYAYILMSCLVVGFSIYLLWCILGCCYELLALLFELS